MPAPSPPSFILPTGFLLPLGHMVPPTQPGSKWTLDSYKRFLTDIPALPWDSETQHFVFLLPGQIRSLILGLLCGCMHPWNAGSSLGYPEPQLLPL